MQNFSQISVLNSSYWSKVSSITVRFFLLVWCLVGAFNNANAQTKRYVNASVVGGANDGSSWGNAFRDLQNALSIASATDQIWVAKGTYYPTSTSDRTISFIMKNGVSIYGGFLGLSSETLITQRDWKNNVTILSGDIGTPTLVSDNSYHVVSNNFQANPLTNTAILDGFSIVSGNANGTSPHDSGGGMLNISASPTLNNIIFSGNAATLEGGGMLNNTASSPKLTSCTFKQNTASIGGGMSNKSSSSPTLNSVSFLGNSATNNGGGMYNFTQITATLNSVIFLGNTADTGGGMYNTNSSSPNINNCTFSGNKALTDGGAMYNTGSTSNPKIKNSILWGNSNEITNFSSNPVITKSVVKGKILGSGIFNGTTNPLFLNQPAIALGITGNLRLNPCSPALNVGDNTGISGVDLNENQRIFNTTIDLGAYEVQTISIATASNNSPKCAGLTINLMGSGSGNGTSVSYNWSSDNGFSSTEQNPIINNADVSLTGVYTITVKDSYSCLATATTSVIVNANPTPVASSNSPICAGRTLNLSSGTTANTYAWTGVSGTPPDSFTSTAQNPTIPNATTSATGNYRVLVTDVNGCTATATTSVIVNALPTATASSNTPICAGTTLTLSGGNGANSYAWTGISGTPPDSFTSTAQNPTIPNATTLATGSYRVLVTDVNGCTATATTSAIVNALPTATASSNTPICAGTSLILSGGNGANTYTWTGINSFASTAQNPTIPNATTAATGSYRVLVTDVNGCTATATTSAIVNALPTATASSNTPICAGTTLILSGGIGANSYAWTGTSGTPPDSFTSTAQNPTIPNATSSATGSYRVLVTDVNGCTATATTSAIVNALPTATASSNTPICAGTTLTLSGGNGANTYAWTGISGTPPDSFASTAQNPTIPNATSSATGSYRVLVTDVNGCTATATTSAIVNALPTATASSNTPICAGTTLTLSGGNGANTYAWTGISGTPPDSFTSTAQNPTIPNATTAATGSYQVLVTDENGCTATATTSVMVNQTPTTPTTQANTQIVFGNSISLTATACNGNLKWYQSADNQLVTMPVSPTATTQYYAKCEETANGITCISNQSNTLTLTVLSPVPPVATGATICAGSNVSLTATGCVGTFVLNWYQNVNDALITMPVSPSTTTDYYAKCVQTFNSVTATSAKSNVVTLTVLNPLTPVATGGTIYKGQNISLNATGCAGAGFEIKWYETATNNSVVMPVSPITTTQYYAKCEQTANSVTCASLKSNDVTVIVINRIFVDINKIAAPIQNGNAWATAYGDLQTGLAAATPNVEVWVAKGIYKPTTTITKTVFFNIPTDIKVYGGFAGTEDALNIRDFRTNTSTLSGEIGNTNITSDNSYHVVVFDGSSNNTVLDGFTITGGNSNFNPNNKPNNQAVASISSTTTIETGGGIALQNGSNPLITNCIIIKNDAYFGGGIYAGDVSKPTITNCKIIGNQATFGSGIYLQNSSNAIVTNTLIAGNKGVGSVYNNASNPILTNCTLSGNGGYSGNIFNSNSQPIVKNSILWGNAPPFNDTQSIISNSTVQGGYVGVGNLNYDPQFVAASPEAIAPNITGDYHLKASSLAINRGDNGSFNLTDVDLDGNLRRFSGGRVDMGAYEFQGSSTVSLVISVASGNWNASSTWDAGHIPQINDTVIIDSNHNVIVNATTELAKNIEFRGTGKIQFNSSATKLSVGF